MANGHGGSRVGSGRKPKSAGERALSGNAGHRSAKVLPHPSATAAPVYNAPEIDPAMAPDDLSAEARAVWLRLAPHATRNGTLTEATALGFAMLCRNVALELEYAGSVMDRGGANHRGLIQRIDAELKGFMLAPFGKPIVETAAVPAVDPLKARYFGGR